VTGFAGAKFKKFSTLHEAEHFIEVHADPVTALQHMLLSTASDDLDASTPSTSNRVIDLTGAQSSSSSSAVERPLVELDVAKVQAANNPELNEALKRIENLKRQLEEVKSENDKATMGSGASTSTASTSPAKKPKENGFIWIGRYKFTVDPEGFVQVYINGCFLHNDSPCAGFSVYFGENHEL
jgi:Caulimovirus viroplasmin